MGHFTREFYALHAYNLYKHLKFSKDVTTHSLLFFMNCRKWVCCSGIGTLHYRKEIWFWLSNPNPKLPPLQREGNQLYSTLLTCIFSNHSHLVPTAYFMVNFSLTTCSEDLLFFFAIYTRDLKKRWPQAAALCALITIAMSTLTILQHHAAPINYSGVVVVILVVHFVKNRGSKSGSFTAVAFESFDMPFFFIKLNNRTNPKQIDFIIHHQPH